MLSHTCTSPNNTVDAGAFVTVNAQATYTPLLTYLGFGSPVTLHRDVGRSRRVMVGEERGRKPI